MARQLGGYALLTHRIGAHCRLGEPAPRPESSEVKGAADAGAAPAEGRRPRRRPPQVTALTTAIGLLEGTDSSSFAMSFFFSVIVSAAGRGGL